MSFSEVKFEMLIAKKERLRVNAACYLSILLLILYPVTAVDSAVENATEKVVYVGSEMVPCVGVAPQMCLQVKESQDDNYTLFYDKIDGFCYQEGYEYVILVREETVENPPADASSLKWTLIEVLSKTGNVTASTLEDVNWNLDSYLNKDDATVCALPDVEVTALFEEGRVSGSAGCNSYGGEYETEGENLNISGIISTLMFCEGPVSDQEYDYLVNLENAASYNVSGNLLRLMDSNGTVVLTYSVDQPLSLTDTNWQMSFYNNGRGGLASALAGTEITALFNESGELTGSAGCNNYMASYQINGSSIKISPAATTRMFCSEPEGIMDQESEYLTALQSASRYELEGRELTLFYANDTRAVGYREASGQPVLQEEA